MDSSVELVRDLPMIHGSHIVVAAAIAIGSKGWPFLEVKIVKFVLAEDKVIK
jgi:hypothetical protein